VPVRLPETMLVWIALFLLAFATMEGVAYLTHRHLMHGPLWVLHESHHRPRQSAWFEANDLFGVFFAVPSIVLIHLGTQGHPLLLAAGLGMTAYGAAYFGFHDVLVHRRIRHSWAPRNAYLRRLVRAHLVHHRTLTREGAVSFGFLYAPDPGTGSAPSR
jgi:beta-carotene 3-hydroxylase